MMSSTRRRLAPLFIAALVLGGCNQPPAQQPAPQAAPPIAAAPAQSAPAPTPAPPDPQPAAPATDASRNDVETPPNISDADLPPLPVTPFPAARPMEVVKAVFTFAAKHPEVLSKVPCFCGCEHMGHRQNDDCFVKARDSRGRPTEWEAHGVG
jgi:hypothetical protein